MILTLKEMVNRKKRINGIVSDYEYVFTNGCFDILHVGHVEFLKEAKSLANCLIVGINDDESVKKIKGESRPIISIDQRAMMLDSIKWVDFVIVFSESTPYELIREIKPNILVKGADWNEDEIVGAQVVRDNGDEVKRITFKTNISTTAIIKRIKNG